MKPTQLNAYLSFDGNCREAMTFYQHCLGGELLIQPFADTPMAAQMPAETHQHVLHARLTEGEMTLFASDTGDRQHPLTKGDIALCLNFDSEAGINVAFQQLSAGGTVTMPLSEAFWGATFGTLTDQFGVDWLLNYDRQTTNKGSMTHLDKSAI